MAIDQKSSNLNTAGQNRLELLLFKASGNQMYGINVFKVREVMTLPGMTRMPGQHPSVVGVVHLRGQTTPVFDMAVALGRPPVDKQEDIKLLVTEFNGSAQAFKVSSVEKIINLEWSAMKRPPPGSGRSNFLTAVADVDGVMVEIIDVERILAAVQPPDTHVPEDSIDQSIMAFADGQEILMVDDSTTAITQTRRTLEPFGLQIHTAKDGAEGLRALRELADDSTPVHERLLCVITDAEMPVMDGYTLTRKIREDESLRHLFVILHSSIDGRFNRSMVENSGCDTYLTKFDPQALALIIQGRLGSALAS